MTEPVLEPGLLPEGVPRGEPDKLRVGKLVSFYLRECSFMTLSGMLKCQIMGGCSLTFSTPSFHTHFLLDVANAPDTLLGTEGIKLSKTGNSLVVQ